MGGMRSVSIVLLALAVATPATAQSSNNIRGSVVPYMGILAFSNGGGALPASYTGIVLGFSATSTGEKFELSVLDMNATNWGSAVQFVAGVGAAVRLGQGSSSLGGTLGYSWITDGNNAALVGATLTQGGWDNDKTRFQLRFEQSLRSSRSNRVTVMIGRVFR